MWYVHYPSFNLKLFSLYSHLIADAMTGKEGIKIPEKRTHTHIHKHKSDQTLKWQLPSQVNFIQKHLKRLFALPPFVFFFSALVHSLNFQSGALEFIFVFEVRIVHSLSNSLVLFADSIKAGCHWYTVNTCRRRQITNCIMYTQMLMHRR